MNAENFSVKQLIAMAHSPVSHYVIPGLTSWLIGQPDKEHGTVRMFHSARQHQEQISPHSHRFAFQAWVLEGFVTNRIWTRTHHSDRDSDLFELSTLRYEGDIGHYCVEVEGVGKWRPADHTYGAGSCYSMTADEVHSIIFSRGARVLFFEGPNERGFSHVLQPYFQGGEVIPTAQVQPWMFKRG